MPTSHVLIYVDGREVVLRRRGLTGGEVLAAVGAHAAGGDLLIREDDGCPRLVSAVDEIEAAGVEPATFRVRRIERLPDAEVEGRLWDWGRDDEADIGC